MENQIDISKLSITELKALAYDLTLELARVQTNLQILNQEIEKKKEQENQVAKSKGKSD
jgi:hypothetical protein